MTWQLAAKAAALVRPVLSINVQIAVTFRDLRLLFPRLLA